MPVVLGNDGEGWKLMTSVTRRTDHAPSANLQLLNTFSALVGGMELETVSNEDSKSAETEPHIRSKRKK